MSTQDRTRDAGGVGTSVVAITVAATVGAVLLCVLLAVTVLTWRNWIGNGPDMTVPVQSPLVSAPGQAPASPGA